MWESFDVTSHRPFGSRKSLTPKSHCDQGGKIFSKHAMSGERTVICLVCGKKFPRGVLDLARHTTAITLQHLISNRSKPGYDFHCSKCDLYFTVKAHLELHQQSVCPVKSKPKPSANVSPVAKPKAKKEAVEDEGADDDQGEKTMECVVCGKLFPRGPIDLARHQTGMHITSLTLHLNVNCNLIFIDAAITLKHLVHPRHTATYHYGCKRCGSHFTTAEHLEMHSEQSTCNPDMVWPSTVAPGSKCISRAEAAAQDSADAAGTTGSGSSNGDELPAQKSKVVKEAVKKAVTPAKSVAAVEVHSGSVTNKHSSLIDEILTQHACSQKHSTQQTSQAQCCRSCSGSDAAAPSLEQVQNEPVAAATATAASRACQHWP